MKLTAREKGVPVVNLIMINPLAMGITYIKQSYYAYIRLNHRFFFMQVSESLSQQKENLLRDKLLVEVKNSMQ